MGVPMDRTPEAIGLWKRIEDFSVDVGDEQLTFCRRLARENGWGEAFAQRVFDEYKRFLFLACEAGHRVTPSDEVDQAWHLHLVYTESYWKHLCEDVLHRPLHHGPTKGGAAENAKFEDWYAKTLASYERIFGEKPPRDIWPIAEVRFGDARRFKRVDTGRHVLVPRALVAAGVLVVGGLGILTASLAMGAAPSGSASEAPVVANPTPGIGWMIAIVVFVAILGLIRVIVRGAGGQTTWSAGGSGCGSDGGSGCGGGCGGCGGGCG